MAVSVIAGSDPTRTRRTSAFVRGGPQADGKFTEKAEPITLSHNPQPNIASELLG